MKESDETRRPMSGCGDAPSGYRRRFDSGGGHARQPGTGDEGGSTPPYATTDLNKRVRG